MRAGTQKRVPRLLLDFQPEIMRKVYSFLMLKDALVVRRTCRQLNNHANDIFRYSHIMDIDKMRQRKYASIDNWKYLRIQDRVLCNLGSNDYLRAVLQNEHLSPCVAEYFMRNLVHFSATDNGEAVSILLKDGRCVVHEYMLENALQQDFSAMATALQQNAVIQRGLQMCSTCSINIGCYCCGNFSGCKNHRPPKEEEESKIPTVAKFCRSCMLSRSEMCMKCSFSLCPKCISSRNCRRCVECQRIACADSAPNTCASIVRHCRHCERLVCKSCSKTTRDEEWLCSSCCGVILLLSQTCAPKS